MHQTAKWKSHTTIQGDCQEIFRLQSSPCLHFQLTRRLTDKIGRTRSSGTAFAPFCNVKNLKIFCKSSPERGTKFPRGTRKLCQRLAPMSNATIQWFLTEN